MRILELNDIKVNDVLRGYSLITQYSISTYGQGKSRALGSLRTKDLTIEWTSFAPAVVEYFSSPTINKILLIDAKVSEYNGKLSLVINSIDAEPTSLTEFDFMKSINVPKVYQDMIKDIRTHLSQNHQRVFSLLLSAYKEQYTTFFAGSSTHDALVGGLMNHSYKMFKLALTLLNNDERLQSYKDELLLGCLMHDFGKVLELDLNKYTKNSFITHRSLGIEILALRKVDIIPYIGEDAYYRLLAIIQGHHGEYGDAPTTFITYLVHLVDMLESQTTSMLDMIENKKFQVQDNGNKVLRVNGNNLTI